MGALSSDGRNKNLPLPGFRREKGFSSGPQKSVRVRLYDTVGFPGGSELRIHPPRQETWVQPLGWEDPLKKEMATHSSTLAGKSHGQRSLVGYSPWGRKRVGHNLATKQCGSAVSPVTQATGIRPSSYRQAPFATIEDLARPPASHILHLKEGRVLVLEEVGPLGVSLQHSDRAQPGVRGREGHV